MVCEWLKTVSLLKSDFTNDKTKPKKLKHTKKNCKKTKKTILLFFLWSFKFLIEKKIIKNEVQNPKTKE